MLTAAKTSLILTGCSSKAEVADSEIVVSHGGLIQHLVLGRLAQTIHSEDAFLKLTNVLIQFAERAYALRDPEALQAVSRILMNLPVDAARQIGLYYYALAANRNDERDKAEALLEIVADNAPITYRARAFQTLGTNHNDKGRVDEALRFQLEALRAASDKNAHGLQTTFLAYLEISHVKSDTGDHKGALGVLENLSPLIRSVSQQNPLYFYFYHNELAVEFAELGRIPEAEAASAIALASPFAAAYPEWSATRDEIAAKRTATPSVVAMNRASEADRSPRVQQQRKLKPLRAVAFSCPPRDKVSFQRAIIPFPATTAITLTAGSILDRMLSCIGPRSPPAVS